MRRMTLLVCLLGMSLGSCAQNTTAVKPKDEKPAAQPPAAKAAPAAATTQPAPAQPAKATEPNAPAEKYDEGPLRAEIVATREVRMHWNDNAERSESESNFAVLVRVRGERLKDITRYGGVVLSELVDDTGKVLFDPNSVTEEERTTLRPQAQAANRLAEAGLQIPTRPAKAAARAAKTLKRLRGEIKLVIASKSEKVTILNPTQYEGKVLEHSRLAELGIEVRVISADELETPPPGQSVILQYTKKADNVQTATFFDGTMRPLRTRERPMTTKSGEKCVVLLLEGAGANSEMQLVLEVAPTIETVMLPVTGDNLPLP